MRICVLGFDHGINDKRIVVKDITYLKTVAEVTYVYRDDISTHQYDTGTIDDKVRFVGIRKQGRGLMSRCRFEDDMCKVALSQRYDYYYLHGQFMTWPARRLRALSQNGKVVYDSHEYDPEPVSMRNELLRILVEKLVKTRDRRVSQYISSAFSVSESICSYLHAAGIKEVHLKPNVSQLPPLCPEPLEARERRLVIAGGVQPERGVETVLRIFKELIALEPGYELVFYANFSNEAYKQELLGYCRALGVEDRIAVNPLISYRQLIEELSRSVAAFMSFPSGNALTNYIALPNRFYDTLAAGTPVIASDKAVDVKNLIREHDLGLCCDPEQPQQSAEAIHQFLTDAAGYRRTLNAVHRFAQSQTWETVSKVLDRVFI